MFLGHWGVGFGAKRVAPSMSLGTLFLAAQFLDLLWPSLLLLGFEHVVISPGASRMTPLDFVDYPISHSLVAACGWGILIGALFYWVRGSRRGALICGLLVPSHWLLDLVVHRPDLPVFPVGGPKVGMGLWSSLPGTLAVEIGLLALGVGLYVRATRSRDRIGSLGLAGLVAFLILVYAASVFGPPPPSPRAIAWSGQAQWLIVAWGYWIDRHRESGLGRLAS